MGSLNFIIRQAVELNSYINQYLSKEDDIEAWILSDEVINLDSIAMSQHLRMIKLVQVRTNHVAEVFLEVIIELYKITKPQLMIFGSESFVSGLAVRVAYRLKGSSCVGVRRNVNHEEQFIVEKLVYSNNLTAKFIMSNRPFCISIAKGFKDEIEAPNLQPVVERINLTSSTKTDWLQAHNLKLIKKAEGLNSAKIVVAVGKGVGSKDNIALFEELAHLVGGALGASRPVVMNAWTGMNHLLGASGSIISPNICIAIGVSGSAAFTVGIEKSKFIIAINKDERAPIFKISDVAICGEYQEVVYELIKLLKSE